MIYIIFSQLLTTNQILFTPFLKKQINYNISHQLQHSAFSKGLLLWFCLLCIAFCNYCCRLPPVECVACYGLLLPTIVSYCLLRTSNAYYCLLLSIACYCPGWFLNDGIAVQVWMTVLPFRGGTEQDGRTAPPGHRKVSLCKRWEGDPIGG